MIHLKSQASLDVKKYDACIQRDTSSLPYAYSWYLDTVCEQWDCLVLNDYDAVWPLPWRKKLGLKYYFRPFGIQQLGIFSKVPLSEIQLKDFYLSMRKEVRFADIYLNEGQFPPKDFSKNIALSSNLNLKLSLNRSYQSLYEGFSTNLKRNLKKAEKENLALFESDGPEVLIQLFKQNQGQRLQLSEEFYRVFSSLLFLLMHKGLGRIYAIYGGPNQLLAGAFFLEHGNRSIFLFSAISEYGRESQAMAYLINEYLLYHADKFSFLDFEGSNQEGLARFYRSFGATEYTYERLYLNRLPWPLKQFRK